MASFQEIVLALDYWKCFSTTLRMSPSTVAYATRVYSVGVIVEEPMCAREHGGVATVLAKIIDVD